MENKLMTCQETADYLGVTVGTLTTWRCTKKVNLPYVKIGALVKYREVDVNNFVNSRVVSNEN